MTKKYYNIGNVSIEIPTWSVENLSREIYMFLSEFSKCYPQYSEVWEDMVLQELISAYEWNGWTASIFQTINSDVSKHGKKITRRFEWDGKLDVFLWKIYDEIDKIENK